MPYVITQHCCNDAACTTVCPVDCIHPTPGEREFVDTEMLYIDPDSCIDCGACVPACPVDAIKVDDELTGPSLRYLEINAAYYEHPRETTEASPPDFTPALPPDGGGLRVAIVGSGPAACYAAQELLSRTGVEVEVFERLPTPWGLIRAGVAPDHQDTKTVAESFRAMTAKPSFRMHLNVEIGTHLSHRELLDHYHAVVYAHGASRERLLDIPGANMPGSVAATDFVGWYNGHPDHSHSTFDLSGERAVIIGNGNVALDMARLLVSNVETLTSSDMAEHAVEALCNSNIREVVVVGRRGPAQAAFTGPELLALTHLPGVDVVVDPEECNPDELERLATEPGTTAATAFKLKLLAEIASSAPDGGSKRIVLRFLSSPTEIYGATKVSGVTLTRNRLALDAAGAVRAHPTDEQWVLDAGLLLHSVGYRGEAIDGVPFDDVRGIIPNDRGRVLDGTGGPVTGVYATGWIKRGPSGVIGTNKRCAQETVNRLLEDFSADRLVKPSADSHALTALLTARQPESFGLTGWDAIDETERRRGALANRARAKVVDLREMLAIADSAQPD